MASAQVLGRAPARSVPAQAPQIEIRVNTNRLSQAELEVLVEAFAADGMADPSLKKATYEMPDQSGQFFRISLKGHSISIDDCEPNQPRKPVPQKPKKPSEPAPKKPPSNKKPTPKPQPKPEPKQPPKSNARYDVKNDSDVNIDRHQFNDMIAAARDAGLLKGARGTIELDVRNPTFSERQLLIGYKDDLDRNAPQKTSFGAKAREAAANMFAHDTERRDSVVVLSRPGVEKKVLFSLPNHCTPQELKAESRHRAISLGLSAVAVYPGLGPALQSLGGLGLFGLGMYQGVRNAMNPENKHENSMELIRSGLRHAFWGAVSGIIDFASLGGAYGLRVATITAGNVAVDAAQFAKGSPIIRGIANKVAPKKVPPLTPDTSDRYREFILEGQKPTLGQRLIGVMDMVAAAPAALARGIGSLFRKKEK